MFRVNFRDLSFQLSPDEFRAPIYLRYLYSLVKPLSDINDNGTPIQFFNQKNRSFYPLTVFISRFLAVDGSRIAVQKYLNELWDPTNEGILIVNSATVEVLYRYNNSEQHTDEYDYNAWDATVDYAASNEWVLAANGNVYESLQTPNVDKEPSANGAYWVLYSTAQEYMFNEADIYTADYTIKIPRLVTMQPGYSPDRFKAQVNFFNAAGRTYQGVMLDDSTFLFNNL